MDTPVRSFNIVIIGDSGVGKTTFLKRHTKGTFQKEHEPTKGVATTRLTFHTSHGKIVLDVHDCGGSLSSEETRVSYYDDVDAAIIMFDITKPLSHGSVEKWWMEFGKSFNKCPVVICGNKCDLAYEQTIVDKRPFIPISARSNRNFEKPFVQILQKLVSPDIVFVDAPPMVPPTVSVPAKREFTVTILGDSDCGKSSFLASQGIGQLHPTRSRFSTNFSPLVFKSNRGDITFNNNIPWRCEELSIEGSDATIVLYDCSVAGGREGADKWVKMLGNKPHVVFGTKCDLIANEGRSIENVLSSKSGFGILTPFLRLAQKLMGDITFTCIPVALTSAPRHSARDLPVPSSCPDKIQPQTLVSTPIPTSISTSISLASGVVPVKREFVITVVGDGKSSFAKRYGIKEADPNDPIERFSFVKCNSDRGEITFFMTISNEQNVERYIKGSDAVIVLYSSTEEGRQGANKWVRRLGSKIHVVFGTEDNWVQYSRSGPFLELARRLVGCDTLSICTPHPPLPVPVPCKHQFRVALIGPPNSGKTTFMGFHVPQHKGSSDAALCQAPITFMSDHGEIQFNVTICDNEESIKECAKASDAAIFLYDSKSKPAYRSVLAYGKMFKHVAIYSTKCDTKRGMNGTHSLSSVTGHNAEAPFQEIAQELINKELVFFRPQVSDTQDIVMWSVAGAGFMKATITYTFYTNPRK
jgi:GTP-binding nuclear protein Ran